MLTHILALLGLIVLLVGWVLLQNILRRNGKEFRAGCGGCNSKGSCSKPPATVESSIQKGR